MPYLVPSDSGSPRRVIPITEDRLMIGRHVDNDVVLNDKAVSGRHALIGHSGGDIVVEDLNSTNGVQVNDRAVLRHVLVDGDRVVIGRNGFVFHAGEPPADVGMAVAEVSDPLVRPAPASVPVKPAALPVAAPPAAELSLMESAPAAPARTPAASSAPPPASTEAPLSLSLMEDDPPAPRVARIEVLSGAAAGRRMDLNKPLNTLGKAGVQVVAVRRERDDRYVLVPVEGPAPTLNDAPMPTPPPVLQSGDVIGLGAVALRFVLE